MIGTLVNLWQWRRMPLRVIKDRLGKLRPVASHAGLDGLRGLTLTELLSQIENLPELSIVVKRRWWTTERGAELIIEAGHTLRMPLGGTPSGQREFLCVTRLADDQWAWYRDRLGRSA